MRSPLPLPPPRPLALVTCALALALAPAARAQKGPKPERIAYYDGKLQDALIEARERNAPLLILCCKEGEEANDRFREQLRDNASLAEKLGSSTIVVLVNDGTHERKTIPGRGADGKRVRVEVCEAYHTASCDLHKRNWDAVYQTFLADLGDGEWRLPNALVVRPDGELAREIAHGQPPGDDEMLAALKRVRAKAGPSLSSEQWARAKLLIQDGQALTAARAWPDAWHAWNELLQLSARGPYAKVALEALGVAEQGMQARLEQLEADRGDPVAAYRALARFAFQAEGTPIEERAAAAARLREKDPAVPPEVVDEVELELEAEGLLREARALLRAGDERKAARVLKRLRGKKYAGTPAAEEAEELAGDRSAQ